RLQGQLAALETRPRAPVSGVDHDPTDRPGRQAVIALVAGDRVQRGVRHAAAEIEDDGGDAAHAFRNRWTPSSPTTRAARPPPSPTTRAGRPSASRKCR